MFETSYSKNKTLDAAKIIGRMATHIFKIYDSPYKQFQYSFTLINLYIFFYLLKKKSSCRVGYSQNPSGYTVEKPFLHYNLKHWDFAMEV